MRVLLVSMPFAGVERPAIGLSLLKAGLAKGGVESDVLYANLTFAEHLGLDAYETVSRTGPHRSLAGDWVFAADMFGPNEERDRDYLRLIADDTTPEFREALAVARTEAPVFLERLMADVSWDRYDVIGFTSFCEQNLAAMAAAGRIKAAQPRSVIVVGGANWHGEMGVAQLRIFPFVDIAFVGEADTTLREVVQRLEADSSLLDVPGLAFRSGGEVIVTALAQPYRAMDDLPVPAYDDYFTALEDTGLRGRFSVTLGVEGSRGCWWAEREPCRFCGLNGTNRAYRAKTGARILDELRQLAAIWPGCALDLVDNVAPESFLREALPSLAEVPLGVALSFEARPRLDAVTLDRIVRAGVSFQVGIESLSDHALHLMHKGLRAVEAVRLLRDCKARGLPVYWNIILGIPGETEQDYREMIDLLPAIRFLQPPATCAPLSLDRFSPYFESFGSWGFDHVRPHRPFRVVYPVDERLLWVLADSFDHAEPAPLLKRVGRYRLRADVRAWQENPDTGELRRLADPGGGFRLRDTRACASRGLHDLDLIEQAVCLACEAPRSREDLQSLTGPALRGAGDAQSRLDDVLDELVAARVLVLVSGRYLSLALPAVTEEGSPSRG